MRFRESHHTNDKAWRIANPEYRMYYGAKSRAKSKQLPFNLEFTDLVFPETCPYLKVPLIRGTRYAPSLDRIIPEKGYVKGNIEIISKLANTMKNNATTKELVEFAYEILERY